MTRSSSAKFAIAAMALVSATPVYADFWGDVARVATAPLTVPAQVTRDVIEGRDPTQAPRDTFGALGRSGNTILTATQRVNDQINSLPRDAINRNLGGDWVQAYNIMTAGQRVQQEMAFTSGRFLGACLQGQPCNLNQLVAMPLAASLRDVYKVYIGRSQPIDPNVARILSLVVPWNVLNSARIIVSATPDMTIPGFLNAGYSVAGQGHAVTVANLIIFSRPINYADLSDWNWLLHELRHIEQYQRYSFDPQEAIDGFSVEYISNYRGMEDDAQNAANSRQAQLNNICRFGC